MRCEYTCTCNGFKLNNVVIKTKKELIVTYSVGSICIVQLRVSLKFCQCTNTCVYVCLAIKKCLDKLTCTPQTYKEKMSRGYPLPIAPPPTHVYMRWKGSWCFPLPQVRCHGNIVRVQGVVMTLEQVWGVSRAWHSGTMTLFTHTRP